MQTGATNDGAARDANDAAVPPPYRHWVLIFCAMALGAYYLFGAVSMYPIPGGDAAGFIPPAVNLEAGKGLTNPLWALHGDPLGQYRYMENPPLFQMVVAACMWKPETVNAFIALAIFNALTLWTYAAFLCLARPMRWLLTTWLGFIGSLLSLLAVAFFISASSAGRPEGLSALILTLGIAVVTWLQKRTWAWCFGFGIGVAAAIHPTHGIFLACLAVLTLLLTHRTAAALRKTALTAALALPLFFILLALGPYAVGETLRAMAAHSAHANAPDYQLSTLVAFYLKLAPWSGLYLVAVALVLGWFGLHVWQTAQDRASRWIRLAAVLGFAFVLWYFSIRSPNKSFYLAMLAPAIAAGALYLVVARGAPPHRKIPLCMLALFSAFFSLWLARDLAVFVSYRTEGVSFQEARNTVRAVIASGPHPVSVSESLWVLTDEFQQVRLVERGTAAGDVMIVQQNQRQSLVPPSFPGYRLVSHRFIPHSPEMFGVRIARTMPGYSFAIYERDGLRGSEK